MKSGIYAIRGPTGDEYIGSSLRLHVRMNAHRAALRRGIHKNRRLQKAWNVHGEDQMSFRIILICAKDDLLLYEQLAIDALWPAYNIHILAANCLGVKRSPETRAKLRAVLTGRTLSPEHRAAISRGLTGRSVSPETRAKIAQQRWKHTEEAKAKMRGRARTSEHSRKISEARRAGGRDA